MTEVATREAAASRAAHIRAGIGAYLTTLAHISTAYAQRDWVALGYESWDAYVNGEYSEHRLKLSPEHRQKAVAELRLAGMSTRAIGSTLGVDAKTVRNDLNPGGENSPPAAPVTGADGKSYAPSRPIPPGQSPTQVAAVPQIPDPIPAAGKQAPAELPGQQDLADAFLSVVDDLASATAPHKIDEPTVAEPIATVTNLPTRTAPTPADDAARMDAELDAFMEGTDARFRRNFTQAMIQAVQVTTFDTARINDLFGDNWQRNVGDVLNRLEGWVAEVRADHDARRRAGLTVVNGGRR
jgi:hypothetical protein